MEEFEYLKKTLICHKCGETKRLVHFQGYYSDKRNFICGSCGRKEHRAKKQRDLRKGDKIYKFKSDVRSRISQDIKRKGYSKKTKTYEILGCDFETLKKHFEKQFTKGMTWDNQGEWHIDHIIPLATATTEEEVIKLNHYTNLQPLWSIDNLSKKDKIVEHQTTLPI